MAINGVNGNLPVQRVVGQPVQKQVPATPARQVPVTDRLELSGVSHLLKNLKTNDVRGAKVAEVRAQLEAGTYENEHKLDVAVDRLLDELSK